MLRQSHVVFYGLYCSKAAGFDGGLFQKLFKGYIFCFLGHLVGGQRFELFARETNVKKKSSVQVHESNNGFSENKIIDIPL